MRQPDRRVAVSRAAFLFRKAVVAASFISSAVAPFFLMDSNMVLAHKRTGHWGINFLWNILRDKNSHRGRFVVRHKKLCSAWTLEISGRLPAA